MKKEECFENYPFWIVFLSNLVSIAIYLIGAFIVYKIGGLWLFLYVILILIQEFILIKGHCVNCYYYGKTCAFGKGRLSSIFFEKGDSKRFCRRNLTWKDLIPDFMVSLIPFVIGIVLLIIDFNWPLLILVAILFALSSFGNSIIRSRLACRYCRQRELGCPAEKLFKGKK